MCIKSRSIEIVGDLGEILGIKPMPILDPNASMNQQMNLLKSNILAAQQYISEAGGDEKALNKFLQEKFRGTLSDSSTVDASTDSDNLTDSNHTDSEMEIEVATKKQKQYDERALRVPLEKGKFKHLLSFFLLYFCGRVEEGDRHSRADEERRHQGGRHVHCS